MNNRFENIIKEKGYTLTSLAEKMGTSKQNLNGMLKSPSFPTLEKMAAALDVPIWRLFISEEELPVKKEVLTITCPRCKLQIPLKDIKVEVDEQEQPSKKD